MSSSKYNRIVINELHEEMGHLGTERAFDLAHQRFFWLRMKADIDHTIKNVCSCVKQKRPVIPTRAPLQQGGYEFILIIMKQFMRFVQAYPTRNKSAKTAVEKLYNDFILLFGFPKTVHDDQGGDFEK